MRTRGLLIIGIFLFSVTAFSKHKNPCSGISFSYIEKIHSQGFLGLATPDADASLIEKALKSWIEIGWRDYEYYKKNPKYRRGRYDRERFKLYELCEFAAEKKVKNIVFACEMDTRENANEDRYGKWTRTWGEVFGSCFMSTYKIKKTDDPVDVFDKLKTKRYGDRYSTGILHIVHEKDKKDRYDYISSKKWRQDRYFSALYSLVKNSVNSDLTKKAEKEWEEYYRKNPHMRYIDGIYGCNNRGQFESLEALAGQGASGYSISSK